MCGPEACHWPAPGASPAGPAGGKWRPGDGGAGGVGISLNRASKLESKGPGAGHCGMAAWELRVLHAGDSGPGPWSDQHAAQDPKPRVPPTRASPATGLDFAK